MRLEQECGVDIDYRCTKCRECSACKSSLRTEAISLKEEAEMELIDQSVNLDLEAKQIICSLPLRGDERSFLTNNRDRAYKVLQQQLKQYAQQPETKELIIKAFEKLFNNGHACYMEDLSSEDLEAFINKETQYWIPWRVAFSDSVSTPARPVLDASARTLRRPDGTGGQSLNDLVCRGKVETLNLLNLVLNFRIGRFAITGDLQQFYNACKLISSQWNLQRFLYQPGMDPNSPVREAIIKTLIYGVSSVSAQSECAMRKLGELIETDKPEVKKLIERRRYVDDVGDSKASLEECTNLANSSDEVFAMVNLKCKCWTVTAKDPDQKVSKDGVSISVAGSPWFPKLDVFVVKVPALHFGKRHRGKLDPNTVFFTGSTLDDMDKFCPRSLNRKQVASKFASIWDITGKLAPVLAEAKCLLSDTVALTADWTTPMPDELRNRWLKQFLFWEKLRGIRFERAVMPVDAIDSRMRLIVKVDAADRIISQACWGGFKRKNGQWSCQQILARNLLTPKNSTIPKSELQALTNGSNMGWIVRKILEDWIDDYIICGDSIIALCWATTEKKSLSLYHRNRAIQIRRGTDLNKLYHVKTEENLADLGTRPEKVRITDIGPDSMWECGRPWMHGELESAVADGVLKPVSDLRITPESDTDFKEGLVFGNDPLNLFCSIANQTRIDKLKSRLEFSAYILNPVKYDFRKMVRIIAIVVAFLEKCSKKTIKSLHLDHGNTVEFSAFTSSFGLPPKIVNSSVLPKSQESVPSITDENIHSALVYLYKKASQEVHHFNSSLKVEKIGVWKEGILLSRARIMDGMNFQETGGLSVNGLGSLGLKSLTPVIDRFSPLAYSIGRHIHWNIAQHRGIETCNRISLEHVHIIQGANLYKELSEECIRCKVKRKKYVEMPMGLISDHQLMIAPPFWSVQMDLFGPIPIYVPGFEKSTRSRKLQSDCHVLVFACPVIRLVNLQVVEKRDASGIVDGITRLACEVGIPKVILMDQDAAFLKVVNEVEYTYKDAKLKLNRELGIEFITCPVSGHHQNGQVERRIRSIQDSLEESGLKNKKLHATGLQTLLKLTENQLNNIPLGYSFGRDHDNTPLLKMITPNMLRVGRNYSRALERPMKLPRGGELLDKVQETYDVWFRIWASSYLPKVMFQPKWWSQERDLQEGDIVIFKKKDSVLESEWTHGKVDQLIRGRDGLSRRAIVKYQNLDEEVKRTTDRSVRSLVKLWSIDDQSLEEDIAILEKQLRSSGVGSYLLSENSLGNGNLSQVEVSSWKQSNCQVSHCYRSGGDEELTGVCFKLQSIALPSQVKDDVFELDVEDDLEEEVPSCSHEVNLLNLLSSLHLELH